MRSRSIYRVGSVLWILGWIWTGEAAEGPSSGPTNAVRQILDRVSRVRDPWSLSDDAARETNRALAREVTGQIDVARLQRKLLGPSARELSPEERAAFHRRLVDLLEGVVYPRAAEFFGELEVELGEVDSGGR